MYKLLEPKKSITSCDLYPHLNNFREKFTEKINTLPTQKKYSQYPNPIHLELKKSYADHLNKYLASNILDQNILFTSGCTEAIDLCLRVYGHSINNIVTCFEPVIPLFNSLAKINDLQVNHIWLKGAYFDEFPDSIPLTSILYVCNPNNPIGNYFTIEKITELARLHGSLIIIDETYIEFSGNRSCIDLIHNYPNLIVVRSFSKGWGLAGLRAGAAIANPCVIKNLQKQQLPFSVNAEAIKKIAENVKNYNNILSGIEKVNQLKQETFRSLQRFPDQLDLFESKTNFIFLRMKSRAHFDIINLHKNLFVTDFSDLVDNSIRLSIYYRNKNREFINIIKNSKCS